MGTPAFFGCCKGCGAALADTAVRYCDKCAKYKTFVQARYPEAPGHLDPDPPGWVVVTADRKDGGRLSSSGSGGRQG